MLKLCQKLRIGYTREGMETLLSRCNHKLVPSQQMLQTLFQRFHFVSYENVQKIAYMGDGKQVNATSFPLSVLEMSAPLRRCRICTLVPPCRHVSEHDLYKHIEKRRCQYAFSPGSTAAVCPSYLESGICRNFQAIGRCQYQHPPGIHQIDVRSVVERCREHTLPVPCHHCTNIAENCEMLSELVTELADKETLLARARCLLSEAEVDKALAERDQSKRIKWGAAKREQEAKIASLQATIQAQKRSISALNGEISDLRTMTRKVQSDCERRKSKGLGKGNGRLSPREERGAASPC